MSIKHSDNFRIFFSWIFSMSSCILLFYEVFLISHSFYSPRIYRKISEMSLHSVKIIFSTASELKAELGLCPRYRIRKKRGEINVRLRTKRRKRQLHEHNVRWISEAYFISSTLSWGDHYVFIAYCYCCARNTTVTLQLSSEFISNATRTQVHALKERKNDKCPEKIMDFFRDPLAKVWLMFVSDQAKIFQETVLKIESDDVAALEVSRALDVNQRQNIKSGGAIIFVIYNSPGKQESKRALRCKRRRAAEDSLWNCRTILW